MTITQAIRSCSPSCFYNLDRIEKSRLCKRFNDFDKKISNRDTEYVVSEIEYPFTDASEFMQSHLSSFGFEFSRTQFNTAKQKASEDQFTLDDYQRHIPKSRSAVGQTVVDLVKSYIHRYSQPSSITGRRVGEDSNGLGTPETPGLKLGLSTFYNVCPKNFKKPTKRIDMCKVCVAVSKVEKLYRSAVSSHGIDSESARKLMKTYQDFKDHKIFVDEQRGRFASLEGNLVNDSCILIYDFKENFKIGGGPVESSDVFYSRFQISDLFFCLVYKSNGHIKRRYYNYLSENLTHDSVYALSCLFKLLKSPDFAIFKNIYLWSDSGPHFRNSEFLCAVMKVLPESFPRKNFFLNYFSENHGKSYVDGHFGVLSKWFD
ncbi:hypothetical protein AYI70_g4167 [Smittium culicis]|uniref:Uncharacterized protein n=2 Tax=Smittium culicis TaxID=133412 RepID=A0A1R1Y0A4_9FUNG|nr:hypothetical protein AYI70_g4167 [Smittium culicis]